MDPAGSETRSKRLYRILAIIAGLAFLLLVGFVGLVWHSIQPWVRANTAAREVEKTGAEVRRIVWSPVYLVFQGPNAASQLEAASPHFDQLFTVTYIIFEDAEVTPNMSIHFRKLRSLQVMQLYRSKISEKSIEQLQAEFPNLEILEVVTE